MLQMKEISFMLLKFCVKFMLLMMRFELLGKRGNKNTVNKIKKMRKNYLKYGKILKKVILSSGIQRTGF